MTLTDALFGIIDNVGLKELFHRREQSLTKLRAPLLQGIERSRAQFEKGGQRAEPLVVGEERRGGAHGQGSGRHVRCERVTTNHMSE